jgi:uncharacterized protein (TIGR02118 family)
MIKLSFCLRRLPHLSREEFQRYWLEKHGPLVRQHAKALGIRRYVQVHSLEGPASEGLRASRGAPEEYDGIAELWFDTEDVNSVVRTTDEARAAGRALLEDERKFIDLANSPLWFSEDKEIIGEEGP